MFYKEQPDLNWRNSKVRQYMLDLFRFWMDKGVNGFRLDVFNLYFKDAYFRDNPNKIWGIRPFDRQEHKYDNYQPEMFTLLREIRQLLDQYDAAYAVGETFLSTAEKAAEFCGDDLLHATFNFEFLQSSWKSDHFLRNIKKWDNISKDNCWPTFVLNNHDVVRSATRYGQGEDDERLKVAATMLLTLRGTPYIYYGEEIGMRDIKLKRSQILDPVGRYYWPFYKGRDGCRSPMQWANNAYAGFSSVQPWLPQHANYVYRNVIDQLDDRESILNYYRSLIKIRRTHPVLVHGDFLPIDNGTKNILMYQRNWKTEQALIMLNFSQLTKEIIVPLSDSKTWRLLLSNKRDACHLSHNQEFKLFPNEACVWIADKHEV